VTVCADRTGAQIFKRAAEAIASRSPKVDTVVGYEYDRTWPEKSGAQAAAAEWGEMSGLCMDAAGHVWAFHRGDVPVEIYDASGRLVRAWGKGQFGRPHQLRIDGQGNVWMADAGLHVVRQYTADGKLLRTLGTPGVAGDDESHFDQPTDMAVAPTGEIYVADGYGNDRVVKFDSAGRFVKAWGRKGTAPGEFDLPHSIALDSKGRLYVADRSNARVQTFDSEGRFLDQWTGLMVPWHIVITPRDEIYVCGSSPMRWPRIVLPGVSLGVPPKDQIVAVFDPTGRMLRQWSFPMGRDAGELDWLHGMAVDDSGNLYLGDIKGHKAQRFVIRRPADRDARIADRPKTDSALKKAGAERQN
jgi:DNA-binding beta-propeller fold protein YncE